MNKRPLRLTHLSFLVCAAALCIILYLWHNNAHPSNPQDLFYQAKEQLQRGNHEKALALYKQYLTHDPHSAPTLYHIGDVYMKQKEYAQAADYFAQALHYGIPQESKAPILFNYGFTLYNLKKYEDALIPLCESLELCPEAKTYAQRALVYQELEMLSNAFQDFCVACNGDPSFAQGFINLGNLYKYTHENYELALSCYQKCKEYEPSNYGSYLAIADLGYLLYIIDKQDKYGALSYENFLDALKVKDGDYKIYHGLGQLMFEDERLPECIAYHEHASAIIETLDKYADNFTKTFLSLGCAYLKTGQFKKGWAEVQKWRDLKTEPKPEIQRTGKPKWTGQSVKNQTILLTWEQGLGDTFQFIRFAKELKKQNARVIVIVQSMLKKIISLCPYIDTVLTDGEKLPPFDYYCSIMETVNHMNQTIESIPHDIPYLYADQHLAAEWKTRLKPKGLNVGLVWHIDSSHDRIPYYDEKSQEKYINYPLRSIPTDIITQLCSIEGVNFYSLHINKLGLNIPDPIIQFPDLDTSAGAFMDTAALMKNLDLIITADTSAAHLAGGLGVKTWLLLCKPGEWRWLHNTNVSPWYPTFTLFRQAQRGNWQELIDRVKNELEKITRAKK